LHLVGATDVEIVANDLLEEFSTVDGTVEDLGETDLHLKDGKLVAVPGGAVFGGEGMWQSFEPTAKEGVDVVGAEGTANLLQCFRVLAAEETVVERLIANPLVLQLPFGPLVAVDPNANGERGVRRELDEGEAKVPVQNVEVVLVDVDLAPVKTKPRRKPPTWRLLSTTRPLLIDAEAGGHLLGHADHDDALLSLEAGEVFPGHLFLAFVSLEIDDGYLELLGEGVNAANETVSDLLEHGWGDHWVLSMLVKKPPEILWPLEQRHVPVEVEAVDAIDLEGDVVAE
jgi:hypothetical protein